MVYTLICFPQYVLTHIKKYFYSLLRVLHAKNASYKKTCIMIAKARGTRTC